MDRTVSHKRFRVLPVVASLGLIAGMLVVLAPPARAIAGAPCRVTDLRTTHVYTGTGSNLQTAIDAAARGTKLRVRGVCVGTYTVAKNLKLIGWPTAAYPTPSLDGNAVGTVLTVNAGYVQLKDLTITDGAGIGVPYQGGGISNFSTLTLRGSSSVTGSTATWRGGGGGDGGGIFNSGTLSLNGSSSVSGNNATGSGGGIANKGTLTLNGWSSVSGNSASFAGGIDGSGTLLMEGHSSVSGNDGVGIANFLGTVILADAATVNGNGGSGIVNDQGVLTLRDSSSVSGNRGGGIGNGSGTVTLNDSSAVSGNSTVGSGGGISNYYGTLTLNDSSSVSGNTATGSGGGIYDHYATLTMNDSSTVIGNRADFDDSSFFDRGGGINACHDTLTGAVDGGNVNDNYRGSSGTVEDDISTYC